MLMPQFDRQDYVSVKFDAICDEFPGGGESMETLLASYVDVFAELRHNGYRIIICSDRASDHRHHEHITSHLKRIGMPYDVIMPSHLLRREGFSTAVAGECDDFLNSGHAQDED